MKEELLKIFADYLDELDFLEREQKEILMRLGMESEKVVPFFYNCFKCMENVIERAETTDKRLSFQKASKCHLVFEHQEIVLKEEDARELLAKMIDLFEPIHPLGTVIELKEKFTESMNLKGVVGNIKVVIVGRFAVTQDGQTYFPYVGSVYPFGIPEQEKLIYFTSAFIHSIVQEGYRDDMEEAYVLLKKKEILLDYDAVSFGFLKKDEAVKYVSEMGVENNGEEKY